MPKTRGGDRTREREVLLDSCIAQQRSRNERDRFLSDLRLASMSDSSFSCFSLALVIACLFAGGAKAEEVDASYYDGTWTARLPCQHGGTCSARVVIREFQGTWQDLSGTNVAKRACGGKPLPLTVQRSTRSELAFTAFGDNVSMACPTLSISLKPVNAKTLEGSFEIGVHAAADPPEVHSGHSPPADPGSSGKRSEGGSDKDRVIRLERR